MKFREKEKSMHKTVGKTDRALRALLAVGAVVGSAVLGFSSGWGIVLLVVAGILVLTGASGYCPAYSLTGINTCGGENSDAGHDGVLDLHRAA
jgi:hypothetical protein